MVRKRSERIIRATVRQLSPLFDALQYAEQFLELARKILRCRDLKIRAKALLTDARGKPILNPKTNAPKVGFFEWPPKPAIKAHRTERSLDRTVPAHRPSTFQPRVSES